MDFILNRPSPFGNETGSLPNGEFVPGDVDLKTKKVLVVGAGGLGCEILKDLALSGFTNVHCIDLDTIDISNLNRQFLFRHVDVGRPKSEVAAEFIMKRIPACCVTPYQGRIQERSAEFYKQFNAIIGGLDNIEARRWLNGLIVGLVETDSDGNIEPATIIPFIDGGTEGFKGQCRVIIPKVTSCFECSIDSFPPAVGFAMCTIANTPRIPEHCIAYAYLVEWDKSFPGKKIETDNPDHMKWVYETAQTRAAAWGIEGVTYFKTLGLVKNIIPAVASTNALISAACVSEAIKILSYCGQSLNTYFMYMGTEGVYSPTFDYGRKDDCIVCCDAAALRHMTIAQTTTLREFINSLCTNISLQLKKPSVKSCSKSLYMQNPPQLEAVTRSNLDLPLGSLIESGDVLAVTDVMLPIFPLSICLTLV